MTYTCGCFQNPQNNRQFCRQHGKPIGMPRRNLVLDFRPLAEEWECSQSRFTTDKEAYKVFSDKVFRFSVEVLNYATELAQRQLLEPKTLMPPDIKDIEDKTRKTLAKYIVELELEYTAMMKAYPKIFNPELTDGYFKRFVWRVSEILSTFKDLRPYLTEIWGKGWQA